MNKLNQHENYLKKEVFFTETKWPILIYCLTI